MLTFVAIDRTGHRVPASFESETTAARWLRHAAAEGVRVEALNMRGLLALGVVETDGAPRAYATASSHIKR